MNRRPAAKAAGYGYARCWRGHESTDSFLRSGGGPPRGRGRCTKAFIPNRRASAGSAVTSAPLWSGRRTFLVRWCIVRANSGGEHAALQTLREVRRRLVVAQRLECGGFSTALAWAQDFLSSLVAGASGSGGGRAVLLLLVRRTGHYTCSFASNLTCRPRLEG